MGWTYEYNGNYSAVFEDFEDVAFAICSTVRFKLEEHEVYNYFIYHDDKLVTIVKASEIDPLSIYAHGWNDKQKKIAESYQYSKIKDLTWLYLNNVVYGKEETTDEDKQEIEKMEKEIYEKGIDIPDDSFKEQMAVKEYKLCFTSGRNVVAKVNQIYFVNKRKFSLDHILGTVGVLKRIYDLNNATEEYSYVMAFDSALNLIGVLPLSHGVECNCDVDPKILYKFLLLVGASQFYLVHNHPTGDTEMSQADYEKTIQLESVANVLNIKMLDHIIVGKLDEVCLLDKAHEKVLTGEIDEERRFDMLFE